ncbi:SusC/RagA family TonB-linked outer membrane protein [Alistipes communis]|uniref:SusC/RagA family TonB-linked outer membrane protein n=1 Tax=Alistipes communis TaxID=2585118 RepID=UPI000305EABD|nr:TonB-dependent receptor [Alistipes communis]
MKQNFRGSWHVRALLLLCLTFQIPWGGELSHAAQTAQQNTIRIGNVTNLKELIRQIEAQTSYKVSYQGNLADNITIKADPSKHNVEELLADALRGTGISYVIRYNTIILTQEQPRAEAAQQASQTRHIAGRVIDAETKEPIIGATVWVKDSALGTNTNVDGAFDYTFTGHYGYIAVSYIGYQTQEFPVTNLPKVIELSAGNELDEVVVVGYGTQKKASVVGSIASVSVNDIRMPTAKISNNLAGQLAGVISVQRSGEPGASSTFWIRGISTFGSSTTPLVLVDGIERDLDLVDIEDIKDFSILKDAAATAIYGVRGANGVILITTREGIVGKPQINIRFEAGMVQPTKVPDMLDAVQFAELWNAAAGSEVYTPEVIQKYRDGSDPDLYPNVDWVDYLYKDLSFNERVNVNVTGGGSTAKYYISGGFYNEDGLFARDNMKEYNTSVFYRKFNFRSNVEVQLHKYTKLNVNLATTFERKNEPGTAASNSGGTGIWNYAIKSAPNVFPAVYSNGLLPGPGANNGENPYVLLTQTGYREKFYNTAQSLFSLTQDLGDWVTKGLTVTVKGSFDAKNYNHLARTKTPPQYMASGRDEFGDLILQQTVVGTDNLTYAESHSGYRSVYLEASVNWARSFGKHDLSALFLYQQSQRNDVGIDKSEPELALPYRHQGIAGRITYSYDNRYFIEGNFGYNGSENFSPGKRFGFFPSVAAGYVISNEKFFEPVRGVIDLLKIKASYGIVGNDKIGTGDNVRRFIYNGTVNSGSSYYFGTRPHSSSSIQMGDWPNPNVGWEEAHKLNVGVDLSLFSKLKISADYFKEKREGIFLQRQSIPVYVGLSTQPWVNIGKMRNSGVDASLEYHQTIGQDLHLTVRGNFTYARNMIVDQDQPDYKYLYMNRTGQARYQTFGLVAAGLFRDQADIDAWPKQSFGDVEPGDIKYLDLNGDGVVDSYDVKPIGYTSIPEIVYGFGFSLQWKAFDFSAFFQGVGHVSFSTLTDQTLGFNARNSREANLFSDVYDNYWTPERLDAKYPRLYIGTNNNNNQTSTFWMANGRYMRLKNLEIGYTLPKRISQKMAMQNMRVYLSGVNLFTFSPFKLWDPDLQTGATNYPNNRIINIGLTIGF